MITKETIEFFFEGLKENRELDIERELLWGYFFLDSDLQKIENLSSRLIKQGYDVVVINEIEKIHDKDIIDYFLHVEKREYHDVDSLYFRNQEFYTLMTENIVSLYDGFDVGKSSN